MVDTPTMPYIKGIEMKEMFCPKCGRKLNSAGFATYYKSDGNGGVAKTKKQSYYCRACNKRTVNPIIKLITEGC